MLYDSAMATGRICDNLKQRFGTSNIFQDISRIPLGSDFRVVIDDEVSKCDVMLVVIGRTWASITDEHGYLRLDQSNDFVRLDIETALRRGIPVIPVLVEGAHMPSEEDLPDSIKLLVYRNGFDVRSDIHFNSDMNELIERLEQIVDRPALDIAPPQSPAESEVGQRMDSRPGHADNLAAALLPLPASAENGDTVSGKDLSSGKDSKLRVISLGAHQISVKWSENLLAGFHVMLYYDDKRVAEDRFYTFD
jgi:TIR domain